MTAPAPTAPAAEPTVEPRRYRTANDLEHLTDYPFDDEFARDVAYEGAQNAYDAADPVMRRVWREEQWGCVAVVDNAPFPGRDRLLDDFEAAVEEAGGIVKVRAGSVGPAREVYPYRLLDRPDGDGWAVCYLIALLSAREVRQLVREHLGPLDVPFVEHDADKPDADKPDADKPDADKPGADEASAPGGPTAG